MESDKDVLDGWCLYEERKATSGSNSSDSESIEIISEDETGNYQIYSKNYFKPENNAMVDAEVTSCTLGNNTSLHTVEHTEEITEYKENDSTHFTIEEGTEACEKDDQGEKTSRTKSKFTECEVEKVKTIKKSDILGLINEKTISRELNDSEPSRENSQNVIRNNDTIKRETEVKEHSFHNEISEKIDSGPSQQSSGQSTKAIVNTSSPSDCETANVMKETSNKNISDISNSDSTCSRENNFTQVRKRKRRNCPEKENENNCNTISANENLHNENSFLCNKLIKNVECNVDKKTRENDPKKFDFSNKKCHDIPSTSSTDETNTEPPTTVNKKQRKKYGDKKSMINENNMKTDRLKNTNNNLSTSSAKSEICEEESPEINNLTTKTLKGNSPNGDTLNATLKEGNVHTNMNMPPEPLDSCTLLFASLVSSVLYLIYSTIFLSEPHPTSTVLPSIVDRGLDTTVQSLHHRYTQLVQDWEARVLENAELDYQIALKEKSEKARNAKNSSWNSNRGSRDMSLPECLHRNILTHAFVHLRSHPPNIHDTSSWNKAKLCVDLAHILSPMSSLPFSSVLRFLLFLLSPSSQLDYDTLYEHYIHQQKIYIHSVIRKNYPEIYESNAFYRPDSKPRASMYCLSMPRFGLLKNRFVPEESDNMLALAKLSDLYVNNENCLLTMVKGDGSSIDQLYDMILDVLLTRSLSTAITLDPALLHDYYLELILSNETNLRKLAKQLFKYNMLAIQKFNLELLQEPLSFGKQPLNFKEKKLQSDMVRSHKNEDKFQKFHDGDDEFFVLNKEYVDKEEKQHVKKDKHKSLGKTHIELFYDAQMREISNGYSSKVAKFLSDINSELKHALCFPYLNDGGRNVEANEEREPLVRFIRNMCRTNVQETIEDRDRKHTTQTRKNLELKDKKYNTETLLNQEFHDKHNQLNGRTNPHGSQIRTKQDELSEQDPSIEPAATESWKFIPNSRREDNKGTLRENMKPVEEIVRRVSLDKKETYNDEAIITTPSVNIDPTLKGFEKSVLTEETDNDGKESAYESDLIYVEESLKNNNIPDIWVLNQMANNFGLIDTVFHSRPHDEYDVKSNENTGEQPDIIEVDNSETLIQEEMASFIRQHQKYKTQFDAFARDNERHKHKGRKKDKGKKDSKRRESFEENANTGNTYHSRTTGESEANRLYTRDTDEYNKNHYNTKENDDTWYNYNKDNTFNRDKDDGKPFHDRSNKEERIVHIDGSDNKCTRHVYIDNANEMEEQAPDDRGNLYRPQPTSRETRHKRHRSERAENSEMDFWSNRRARLRAKLRKKTSYPIQSNPEHQYDYVYA